MKRGPLLLLLSSILILSVLFDATVAQGASDDDHDDDDDTTAVQQTCNDAIYLPPPYSNQLVVGSTTSRPLPDDVCSPARASITYSIAPAVGNELSFKACGAGPLTDLVVTVYSDSCWDPKCVDSQVLEANRNCESTTSMLSFTAQETQYWVVVSTSILSEGQFSLTINERYMSPLAPACAESLSLYGPYDPTLSLYGAVSAGGPNMDMPCHGGSITTEVVWYKIFPYENYVTVSTCNPGSVASTSVDVFIGDCDDPSCVNYVTSSLCSTGDSVTFRASPFDEYYFVVVYGDNGSTGTFQLTISERFELPTPSVTPSVRNSRSSRGTLSVSPTSSVNPPIRPPSQSPTMTQASSASSSSSNTRTSSPTSSRSMKASIRL